MVISTSEYDRRLCRPKKTPKTSQPPMKRWPRSWRVLRRFLVGGQGGPRPQMTYTVSFPRPRAVAEETRRTFGFASPVPSNFSALSRAHREPRCFEAANGVAGVCRSGTTESSTIEDQRLIVPSTADRSPPRGLRPLKCATSERNTRIAGICRRTTHPCPLETTPSAGESANRPGEPKRSSQ